MVRNIDGKAADKLNAAVVSAYTGEMLRPDYDNSLVNLVASCSEIRGGKSSGYKPLSQLQCYRLNDRPVVMMVLDGLGYEYLSRFPDSHLYKALQGRLTSVFPTTTATAVSALALGVPALQHSITGWFTYLKELGCVAAPLPFIPRGGGSCFARFGIKASALLDQEALLNKLQGSSVLVTPQYIAGSSYTEALFADIDRKPFQDLEGYFDQIEAAVNETSDGLIWAYWTEFDAMSHSCGVNSTQVADHFQQLDEGFFELTCRLAGTDAILLVTADHGLIDTRPDRIVHLHHHPELQAMLQLPLCGEPRAAFCYLRPGAKSEFDSYIHEHLDHCLQVFDCDDVVDYGWFGRGVPAPRFRERIGDRLLLPKENWIIKDRLLQESPFNQIGVHGGLSEEELYVPLVVAEC